MALPKGPKAPMDLVGQKFGRLSVIDRTENSKSGGTRFICKCDCGNEVVVVGGNLRSGNTTSCGCFHKERVAAMNREVKVTHGKTHTRLYTIWTDMKQRCKNVNDRCYDIYGGRGITVCDEWANDFENFYEWAMSNGYQDSLSIDREDNDKGYCPSNCRWATAKDQANNRRKPKKVKNQYGEWDYKSSLPKPPKRETQE